MRTTPVCHVQTGLPLTISVFGDTANAGTVVGENPIRANLTGARVYSPGTRFGSITEAATPGRQIQLSARLSF